MFNKVLFIGSKESGLKVLKEIYKEAADSVVGCVTVDDSDDARSELEGFIAYCCQNNIPIDILKGKCDLTESIKKYVPDLCIVMGWYYIIAEELLDEVKGGFIGIHNSLLPKHRGFAPVVWSIIAGDNETGFSVFSFDKGMDTGDIWYQGKVNISKSDYVADVLEKLDEGIYDFFKNNYLNILSGKMRPSKQIEENVSYGARRTPENGKIDWSRSAEEIYDFIRAQSKPYPGAYTTYRGEKVVIWRSEIFPHIIQGTPGQIGLIDVATDRIIVVCGNNTGLVIAQFETDDGMVSATKMIKSLNYNLGY